MMNRLKQFTKEDVGQFLIRALAVIGFVGILLAGLWGTVQIVKFAPNALSSLAAVGTTLTSIFIPGDQTPDENGGAPIVDNGDNENGDTGEPATTTENGNDGTDRNGTASTTTGGGTIAGERKDQVFPIFDSRHTTGTEQDLAVTILGVGIIENGQFLKTGSLVVGKRGAVHFQVQNVGGTTSSNWTFNAVLPSFPLHIFHSPSQQQLAPGDRIEFTLGFDQINANLAEGVITINADPTGSLKEASEANNIRQVTAPIIK